MTAQGRETELAELERKHASREKCIEGLDKGRLTDEAEGKGLQGGVGLARVGANIDIEYRVHRGTFGEGGTGQSRSPESLRR